MVHNMQYFGLCILFSALSWQQVVHSWQWCSHRHLRSPRNSRLHMALPNLFQSQGGQGHDRGKQFSLSAGDVVREYFSKWNIRDFDAAVNLFDEDCVYEDTLYPTVFEGKDKVKYHLERVGKALPDSFVFVIDELVEDRAAGKVGVQWHVEAEGNTLPFTRGSSIYVVNKKNLIVKGFDVPEPVLKAGSFNLSILKLAKNFITDPVRIIPAIAWVFYCW